MRVGIVCAFLAATALTPVAALAQNAAGGAVGGAIVGGVVGGPVGAAVGAGVGATVGAATQPPDEVVTYVERESLPSVRVEERVVVGERVPETVVLREVPRYEKYRYAVVNEKRVIVDPSTRKVIKIIEK